MRSVRWWVAIWLCLAVSLPILSLSVLRAQEFDQEISSYRSQLEQNPNNIEALIGLARYLSWSEQLEEALVYYNKALKLQPGHIEARIGIATIYAWQKKYTEAINVFKAIIKKYPDNVDALTGLGRVYSWQGKYDPSIQAFKKALEFAPNHRGAVLGLGRVYSWDKQYKKSEAAYKKLLKKNPDDLEILRGLANTYKWGENYTKGIEIELKILRLDPENIDSMISIGYMYYQIGAIGQSIHWYETAAKLAPDRGDIQGFLGILYTRNQQIDSAATAFKKAITLEDLDIQSYISLGRVYSWQNKMEDSEKLYQRALEINPQSAGAYAGLGQLYFFNGLWDRSIDAYQKALQLDPYYVEAIQGLERVRLLKAPALTVRYHHFIDRFRRAMTHTLSDKIYVHETAYEYLHKFSPGKAIEGRVKLAQTASNNSIKVRNYLYNELTLSARLDYPIFPELLDRSLFFSGRFDQVWFANHSTPNRFQLLKDEHFQSGYSLLRLRRNRFWSVVSFSREALVATVLPQLLIDPLDTYSSAMGYDVTDQLTVIGNYFFQNFEKRRGFPDRREFRGIFQYRLPFLKTFELSYQFRHRNHPSELTNVGSIRFSDRFIKDKLLVDAQYIFLAQNGSENFGVTLSHVGRLFSSYEITKWLRFNTDVQLEFERNADRDYFHRFRVYTTVLFD